MSRAPSPALATAAQDLLAGRLTPRAYARRVALDRIKALSLDVTPDELRALELTALKEVEALLKEADAADDAPTRQDADAVPAAIALALVHRVASRVSAAALPRRRWRWRTAVDSRVRPEHAALDRKVFDAPHPTEGLPGDRWGCRCWMERV